MRSWVVGLGLWSCVSGTGSEPPSPPLPAVATPPSAAASAAPELPFDDPKSCDATVAVAHASSAAGSPPSGAGESLEGDGSNASPTMMGTVGGSGRLSVEVIRQSVRERYRGFRACYEGGLGRHPTLRGNVILRFVIDRSGKVSQAAVAAASDLPDCAVWTCMREQVLELEFPPPEGGTVKVSYPIWLERG